MVLCPFWLGYFKTLEKKNTRSIFKTKPHLRTLCCEKHVLRIVILVKVTSQSVDVLTFILRNVNFHLFQIIETSIRPFLKLVNLGILVAGNSNWIGVECVQQLCILFVMHVTILLCLTKHKSVCDIFPSFINILVILVGYKWKTLIKCSCYFFGSLFMKTISPLFIVPHFHV